MELYVWPEDHGLPSFDPLSLQMMTYCRFAGVQAKVIELKNSWRIITHKVPMFTHGFDHRLTSFQSMIRYLQKQGYNADSKLSAKDRNNAQAYSSVVAEKLEPAWYLFWVRSDNFAMITRPWYAHRFPFPTNFFLPGYYQSFYRKRVAETYSESDDLQIEKQVDDGIQKTLALLSQKLGENEYFFGSSPTSLDAYVFGFLAPLAKVPLPSPASTKNSLKDHPNLEAFISRIIRKYFPGVKAEPKDIKKDSGGLKEWFDIFGSTLFALTAMSVYAYYNFRR
ncbi:metaxin-1 isoform X2 [Brevipalpus obovatus]|uniref:metaxin-1 isoform X2 n=1 Tax=Brevipalpus obovatus TaxID=246614 RepID=UPI003D9FA8CE